MSGKNYYEILGIRPNAGREEVDLAYKGRRSQYHPDRYAQSDAETQVWATAKMQEVNEAYRVLSSPELRAESIRRRSSGSADKGQFEQPPNVSAHGVRDAASVLLQSKWEWFHDKVYARPNIPYRKLEGAISSYAPAVSSEEVIVLLDDTVFGGAKEGLLVTNDAIYCKQKFESPRRIALSAIRQVRPGSSSRVLINEHVFFKADVVDHLAVLTFASRLSSVFEPITQSTAERPDISKSRNISGSDGLRVLHRCALASLQKLGSNNFLLDGLIDRQMQCVSHHLPSLHDAVGRASPRPRTQEETISGAAEFALVTFLMLHYYALSKLPSEFKTGAGSNFAYLHGVSEIYKATFRENFPMVFGRPMEMSEEDILMMSGVFFHRDGAQEFELNVPREEALSMLFSRLGVRREIVKELTRQFEDHTEWWFDVLCAAANK